jgi:hypothetical protein
MGRWLTVAVIALLAIAGIGALSQSVSPPANPGGSTAATLNVLPTTRSITVSPGNVTFENCRAGNSPNSSTATQLGYPNGECFVGIRGSGETFPIKIDNTGIPATIKVEASNAIPGDHGKQWQPCSTATQITCTGPAGSPGFAQYAALTEAKGQVTSVLTGSSTCDFAFDPSGGCQAGRQQSGKEGIALTGPTSFGDPSTSWTITITWIAAPVSNG